MLNYIIKIIAIVVFALNYTPLHAQYTRQDTLRGSIGNGRIWWDVMYYKINIDIDIANKKIKGYNEITFKVTQPGKNKIMQLDLQKPMEIDKIQDVNNSLKSLPFKREGNVYWVDFGDRNFKPGKNSIDYESIIIYFTGNPHVAINAPWDGGWVWAKDERGRPWVTVACQGLGASVWYPCKDHQSDEPDNGASLTMTVPDSLVTVGNGRLRYNTPNNNGTVSWNWVVANPINNYNIIPYIGKYVNWQEEYTGEKGKLDCSYWVLDYNLEKAKKQFGRDVKPMLACFENWFGPYPFYKDSYKMVETPHLGMEHQSAVAYGNKFFNGYLGRDLSGTGWGNNWDYIIIHESGHEWFANNITTNDIADMWVHEGFTNYSEVIFVECQYGKKAGNEYCQGLRGNIKNDKPVIGNYGVNNEGSGDMYAKGANLLHTIRQVIDNDATFKKILRGLNKEFYHKVIDSKDVESYISQVSGKNLSKIFDQYLRTVKIPELQYQLRDKKILYRWANCVTGFNMPVKIFVGKKELWIKPTEKWQPLQTSESTKGKPLSADKNFYITVRKI